MIGHQWTNDRGGLGNHRFPFFLFLIFFCWKWSLMEMEGNTVASFLFNFRADQRPWSERASFFFSLFLSKFLFLLNMSYDSITALHKRKVKNKKRKGIKKREREREKRQRKLHHPSTQLIVVFIRPIQRLQLPWTVFAIAVGSLFPPATIKKSKTKRLLHFFWGNNKNKRPVSTTAPVHYPNWPN